MRCYGKIPKIRIEPVVYEDSNIETRNSKQYQMTRIEMTKTPSCRHMIWACLFFFTVLLPCPLPAWSAIAEVNIIHSRDQYPAGGSYPILFKVSISSPWYIHGTRESENGLIPTALFFPGSQGVRLEEIQFPEPERRRFAYAKEQVDVFSREFLVRARLVVSGKAAPGKQMIKGRLSYQACSSRSCLPPEDAPVFISLLVVSQGAHAELRNQEMFEAAHASSAFRGPATGWKSGASLWLTLIGIFLGGLALNLTPCIYPLIPITVSYFGGMSHKTRGRSLVHGLLYISGLAFTNSLLGLTASLSGGMLGSALQNPIVLIMVAGILVSLALSFFGLWELQLPSGLTRLASKNFGGYSGTFFMGLTLGIVAAPCLGPFILGLLTYVGQKGDPLLGFLYFFVLSIGLGLPLSILAVFSGSLERLPMSGAWMVWIRKVLGWVLVVMAGYLLQPLVSNPVWKSALLPSILVVAGLHLGWLEGSAAIGRVFPTIKKALGIILIVAGVTFLVVAFRSGTGIHWIPYDQSILLEAGKKKRPVILDFYADWCGPCKALERKVFRDPEVVKLSRRFVSLRVDLTTRHPRQNELLGLYQIRGVPTIIFINGRGAEERALRVESYINRNELLSRMRRLLP